MSSSPLSSEPIPSPAAHANTGAAELHPGSIIADRYRIDELLGEGNAGKVYLVEHVLLRKKLALKVLRRDLANVPEITARFEREAMAAANIEHPNIAGASDFGRLLDGSVFLALEYVPGRSLRSELGAGRLSLERSLHIAIQIAAALSAAQELDIVHRDLKPENVMLTARGNDSDFVKVLDFGIARVPMAETGSAPLTRAGVVFGTPEYMAPEQALGQRADGRADLYSLGVMLFEMIAGVRPFDAGATTLGQQVSAAPPPFSKRVPGLTVPIEVERVVHKLMARERALRFATAEGALAALKDAKALLTPGESISPLVKAKKKPLAIPRVQPSSNVGPNSQPPKAGRVVAPKPPSVQPPTKIAAPPPKLKASDAPSIRPLTNSPPPPGVTEDKPHSNGVSVPPPLVRNPPFAANGAAAHGISVEHAPTEPPPPPGTEDTALPASPPPPPVRDKASAPPAAAPNPPREKERLATFMPGDPLPAFDMTEPLPNVARPAIGSEPAPAPALPVSSLPIPEAPTRLKLPNVERESLVEEVLEEDLRENFREPAGSLAQPNPSAPSRGGAWQDSVVSAGRKAGDVFTSFASQVGLKTLSLHQQAVSAIEPRRSKLPGPLARLSANALLGIGAGLVLLLVIGAVGLASRGSNKTAQNARTETELSSATTTSTPSAESPSLPEAPKADANPVASPAAQAAPSVASAPKSESQVLLDLAADYVAEHRDAEALGLVSRVLARDSALRDNPQVAKVLAAAARSDVMRVEDESFALLQGPMGERGPEVLYELWLDKGARERVRHRAEDFLRSKNFDRLSSAALYSAVKLRLARTCEQKRPLLDLAARVGGRETLVYLKELAARATCEPGSQGECYACLSVDGRLNETIAKVEARL
ncbi:MAG TPA: protein kinase [Polyangiaceae bacterium]|nr:protein kinase [Polyangiaceae bacterium]